MKIILVAFGTKKADHACKAKEMSLSPLFTRAMEYARRQNPDRIYILSGKYGLLNPETVVEPYDPSYNKKNQEERKIWSRHVLAGLTNDGVDLQKDEFVFLVGKKHYQFLAGDGKIPEAHIIKPYDGFRGIGEIIRFLNEQLKK